MKLIGLAGPARVGKDTIADYLVENHNFLKFAFSDALYIEVQEAFGLFFDQHLLRDADTKEVPTDRLSFGFCRNVAFVDALAAKTFGSTAGGAEYTEWLRAPRSPRWVLQRWGTDYRRDQDPDYWIKQSDDFVRTFLNSRRMAVARIGVKEDDARDRELARVQGLVQTTVRFANEVDFIDRLGGEVWHIYRREAEAKHLGTYVSELRLPVRPHDKEIYNNGEVEALHTAASLMLAAKPGAMLSLAGGSR